MKNRYIIGITGPMAAGKNAAADILREKNFTVLDADVIAHSVLCEHTAQIAEMFKEKARKRHIQLLNADGSLNRRALGSIVFSGKKDLQALEHIIHPEVNRIMEEQIEKQPLASFVVNAALLHKIPIIKRCDCILYIHAPLCLRIKRVRRRDELSFFQIAARFFFQQKNFAKCKKQNADIYIVENSKTQERLKTQILRALNMCINKG